jgi:hypothetical protein
VNGFHSGRQAALVKRIPAQCCGWIPVFPRVGLICLTLVLAASVRAWVIRTWSGSAVSIAGHPGLDGVP